MQNKKHYHWIDLLRFISALLVVLAHYRGAFFVEYRLLPVNQQNIFTQILFFLTRLGEEPVLIFFVLSGFLVGGKAMEKILNNRVDIKSYSIDRSVRILLPLIASSLLVIVVDLITDTTIPFKDIIGSIFSLQGILTTSKHNAPLWSLSYEVWFYLLIGCIMAICRSHDNKTYFFPFVLFTICIYIFIVALNPMYLLILLMGTFAFLLPRQQITFLKSKISILVALMILSFLLSQISAESRSFVSFDFWFMNRKTTSIFLAFISALLIHHLVVATPKRKIGTEIDHIGSRLSDFSYSLYLTHYPLISLLSYLGFQKSERISTASFFYYAAAVLLSLVIAYLIYLISEKQTFVVKNLIKKKFINI